MNIKTNFPLKDLNSFNIDVKAKEYIKVDSIEDFKNLTTKIKNKPILSLSQAIIVIAIFGFVVLRYKTELK